MSYTTRLATETDLPTIARIQRRAFDDPTNATVDELALLIRTDPLTGASSRSEEENQARSIERTRPLLSDGDYAVVVAVPSPQRDGEGEGKGEGEPVAFGIYIRPVRGGIKTKPVGAPKEEEEKREGGERPLMERFSDQLDATRSRVMGDTPHWFLKLLCVDPAHQRRGLGTLLLNWGFRQAQHDRGDLKGPFDVYLESSPAGEGTYIRAGFEVLGSDRLEEPRAKKGYLAWPYMLRKSRR